jgi:hypothetical protein
VFLLLGPFTFLMLYLAVKDGLSSAGSLWGLLFVVGIVMGTLTVGGSWTLTLDRGNGWAALRRGPWRTRRQLGPFIGVGVFSLGQHQIERVRQRQVVMPYVPYPNLQTGVVLVERDGRRWRVTRSQDRAYGCPTPQWEDAVLAARLVANYLGLPFLPPYERPPGGLVPPPL